MTGLAHRRGGLVLWKLALDFMSTAHRELGEDAYDLKGSCGFSFGDGCSDGRTETGLFGTPRAKTVRTPTEFLS